MPDIAAPQGGHSRRCTARARRRSFGFFPAKAISTARFVVRPRGDCRLLASRGRPANMAEAAASSRAGRHLLRDARALRHPWSVGFTGIPGPTPMILFASRSRAIARAGASRSRFSQFSAVAKWAARYETADASRNTCCWFSRHIRAPGPVGHALPRCRRRRIGRRHGCVRSVRRRRAHATSGFRSELRAGAALSYWRLAMSAKMRRGGAFAQANALPVLASFRRQSHRQPPPCYRGTSASPAAFLQKSRPRADRGSGSLAPCECRLPATLVCSRRALARLVHIIDPNDSARVTPDLAIMPAVAVCHRARS